MKKSLLIVDDNEDILRQLYWGFKAEEYEVHQAKDVEQALEMQKQFNPQVVTLDLGLPPDAEGNTEGFRCLDALLLADPLCKVIVITGHHDSNNAQNSIRSGAYDFCRKPIDLEELKIIVRRAFFLYELNYNAAPQIEEQPIDTLGIITQDHKMIDLFKNLKRVAESDAPVLIEGESGTGKELIAKAVHQMSSRNEGPLIIINCGAIPEHLLEAEFFGHEKGAFTGAAQRVQGKVEFANNGTLFLDEMGELPLSLQVKLLRFLQEMTFQRVGGRQDIEVNVRIIAATNRNLLDMVNKGQFREDLYYRIGVVKIPLPPLRDRGKDVLLLANHFIKKYNSSGKAKSLHPAAEKAMLTYSWPGNIRQLENKIRQIVILADTPIIQADMLDLTTTAPCESTQEQYEDLNYASLQDARNAIERKMLVNALQQHAGNVMQASQLLGVSRPTFYDLLKKHKITL